MITITRRLYRSNDRAGMLESGLNSAWENLSWMLFFFLVVWEKNTLFVFSKWFFGNKRSCSQCSSNVNFASSYFFFCFWGNKRLSFSVSCISTQGMMIPSILQRPLLRWGQKIKLLFLVGGKKQKIYLYSFWIGNFFLKEDYSLTHSLTVWLKSNIRQQFDLIWFDFHQRNTCILVCH